MFLVATFPYTAFSFSPIHQTKVAAKNITSLITDRLFFNDFAHNDLQIQTRWLYCMECPQDTVFNSKRSVSVRYTSCIRRGLVSRDSIVDRHWLSATD